MMMLSEAGSWEEDSGRATTVADCYIACGYGPCSVVETFDSTVIQKSESKSV